MDGLKVLSTGLVILTFVVAAVIIGNAVWRNRPTYIRFVLGCVALALGLFGFPIAMTILRDFVLIMLCFEIGFGWVLGVLAVIAVAIGVVKWIKAPPTSRVRS